MANSDTQTVILMINKHKSLIDAGRYEMAYLLFTAVDGALLHGQITDI